MPDLFLTVLNMSITSGLIALIIILLRGTLGRALPRIFSYALWAVVLFRMICPISFPSVFSALGKFKTGLDIYTSTLKVTSLKEALNFEVLSGHRSQELSGLADYPAGAAAWASNGLTAMNISPAPVLADYFSAAVMTLWLLGIAALLIYNVISYGKLCRSIGTATLFKEQELVEECKAALHMKRAVRVYESDKADSPFVCGILRPKVILPAAIKHWPDGQSRESVSHILLHELYHVKRFDYIVKPLAFLAVCVHWFNPILWISFRLSEKDMELSCDEGALKALKTGTGGDYAETLLNMASAGNGIGRNCVLAFHESNVKERVKHIVKYKKPGLAAGVASVVILIICAVTLLSNPASLAAELKDGQINTLVMCRAEGASLPDTFLLVGYNEDEESVNFMFLPRDLEILPDDGKMGIAARKLSRYAGENPTEAVMAKLNENLGIEIDHFIKLDTGAFRDLVDAVGGVTFDVPMRMVYKDPLQNLSIDLEEGRQVLDGEKAEMLVRFRKGYLEGDLSRIEVEKAFLAAMIDQNSDIRIGSAVKIYQAMSGEIETDISVKEAKALIPLLRGAKTVSFVDPPVVRTSDPLLPLVLAPDTKEALKEKF